MLIRPVCVLYAGELSRSLVLFLIRENGSFVSIN